MTNTAVSAVSRLVPYVPKLLLAWSPTGADDRHMRVSGSLAFVDISGFTRLTERLGRKVGVPHASHHAAHRPDPDVVGDRGAAHVRGGAQRRLRLLPGGRPGDPP